MRGPALEHAEDRPDHAADCRDLPAFSCDVRGNGEIVAEELVGTVDEVDIHWGECSNPSAECYPLPDDNRPI